MADTLGPDELYLIDNWSGTPSPDLSVPEGGDFGFFNGSRHHSQTSEIYRIGEKVRVYNDPGTGAGLGKKGWGTMIYLQVATPDGTAIIAGHCVTLDVATTAANAAYSVTNDPASTLHGTAATNDQCPVAIAISTITAAEYGWFWCGGVCPMNWLLATATTSLLSSTSILTDGSVTAGGALTLEGAGAVLRLKLAIAVNGTAENMISGVALATDAA
jgi:hypothetical protein